MPTDSTPGLSGGEASGSGVDPSDPPSVIVTPDDLDTAAVLLILSPDGGAHIYSATGLDRPGIADVLRATAHSLDDTST